MRNLFEMIVKNSKYSNELGTSNIRLKETKNENEYIFSLQARKKKR